MKAEVVENMPKTRPTLDRPPIQQSSGLAPGQLPGVDGRTWAARRYRELVAHMASDLGGDLTAASTAIVCRAAALITWTEKAEAEFATTGQIDIQTFTTATNSLRRLLADIGLDRRELDVTPTLEQYLAAKRESNG